MFEFEIEVSHFQLNSVNENFVDGDVKNLRVNSNQFNWKLENLI